MKYKNGEVTVLTHPRLHNGQNSVFVSGVGEPVPLTELKSIEQ